MVCLVNTNLQHFIYHGLSTNNELGHEMNQSHVMRLTWLPGTGSMEKVGTWAKGALMVATAMSRKQRRHLNREGGWSVVMGMRGSNDSRKSLKEQEH